MDAKEPQVVDYYARLGVPADASPAEIKSVYRDLVKRYHPDVYPFGDLTARRRAELEMRQINEAYAVLRAYPNNYPEAALVVTMHRRHPNPSSALIHFQ